LIFKNQPLGQRKPGRTGDYYVEERVLKTGEFLPLPDLPDLEENNAMRIVFQ
jgi:hypothetical protein